MFGSNVKYPLRYLSVSDGKRLNIESYQNWGPNPSVTGIRKLYNLYDALLVKCGQYVYNVNWNIYCQAK